MSRYFVLLIKFKKIMNKNFDVEIAVDSTYTLDNFDTFILFSGDCDFEYLIKFLRGQGKVVIGFSRSGNVAREIPLALTNYFDIADFRKEFLRIDERKAKHPKPFDLGLAVDII